MGRQRLLELDLAKGLAIFLVVFGHIVSGRPPTGNGWYGALLRLVYEFHMPFFMMLSGAVFQITFRPGGLSGAASFVFSRIRRLFPAFAIFSIVIWAGKHAAAPFLDVDNFDTTGWGELLGIYVSPTTSVARSLWYIYTLLQLYALFAMVLAAVSGRLLPAVLLAIAMRAAFHFVDVPTLLGASALCEYAIFFVVGVAFARHYDPMLAFFVRNSLAFYGLFAASFLALLFFHHTVTKGLIGLASLPAGMIFASSFASQRDRKVLLMLGQYAFTIYLMNTIFIGLLKGVLMKFVPWDGHGFVLYFFVLLGGGLLGPIAVHRFLFSRIPPLAAITK